MKVCWLGFYKKEYSRNAILMQGLKLHGVTIIECNVKERTIKKYFRLITKLRSLNNEYDVVVAAFPAHYAVIIAKLFQKRPIIADAFFPLHDANVADRAVANMFSFKSLWFWVLDRLTVKLPEAVITDTKQHAHYWKKYHGVTTTVIPLGVQEDVYKKTLTAVSHTTVKIVWHGSYIPLQGVDRIIDAVNLLPDCLPVAVTFVGQGQLFDSMKQKAIDTEAPISFKSWMKETDLAKELEQSDIVLGIFGDTNKADRVVPNKVMQGVAVGRPVITKDTPAIREQFSENELYLVDNKPREIAKAVIALVNDINLREELAERAYTTFTKKYSTQIIGKQFKSVVNQVRPRS